MKLNEINIRDPFILPFDGQYYLYGTRVSQPLPNMPRGHRTGFDVYISSDLQNWSTPKSVFEITDAFWAETDAWAPEVHFYNGAFYMFASFKAEGICRGTHILTAPTPDSLFVPVSDTPITPSDWECLDGTLYIDKQGEPHIVFCHEWLQVEDGTICEMKLSKDLTTAVSEPRVLWSARQFPHVKRVGKAKQGYVTDGPFMYRNQQGELLCIWSTVSLTGYTELVSKSSNADIDGHWQLCQEPLSESNGGHGMIFRDFSGQLLFIMHQPNNPALSERPVILNLSEDNGKLTLF